MSPKEQKRALLESLNEKLIPFGFKPIYSQQLFRKAIDGGRVFFHLAFIQHYDSFDITSDVAIRLDIVEDLINAQVDYLSQKEKKETATFGVELGNLSIGEQKRWTIESDQNIPPVADSIFGTYRQFGEPYLSQYANLESAYQLLSRDDSDVWKHCPSHGVRAKKAVALAKILGKDDIQSLISRKRKVLEDMNDFGLSDYLKFIESLSE